MPALGACAVESEGSTVAPAASSPATTTTTDASLPRSNPTHVRIPKIGVESTLVPLGLNKDGTLQVPPLNQAMQAGWYRLGPTPGEVGPAVIAGHVDGDGHKGVFYDLKSLAPGDDIDIDREDGTTAHFRVDHVSEVPKNAFPTEAVYGDTDTPELRLITCGGAFDRSARSYVDNIIVFADLT
ncbi:class F sortase [Amycolatopsis pigmentata]|uniref:Class F sortase n=1 Tax=Amycolatopsis pigmentata TaxID=450801 RepID=A0ABW5FK15_9PSEU